MAIRVFHRDDAEVRLPMIRVTDALAARIDREMERSRRAA